MTDYKRSTGSTGEMLIRDNGSVVSFMINSHSSSTFNHDLPWGYTVNGVTNNNRQSDYSAGDGWVTLGSWTVTSEQTVTFRLFDTNTSGFGGPTTLTATIVRTTVPDTPTRPLLYDITATSMRVVWSAGDDNGSAIDLYQVARNTVNSVSGATVINTDTDNVFTGLTPGTTYYWWARTHNAKGYSAWTAANSAPTLQVPAAPNQVIVSDATQTSFIASFTDGDTSGLAVLERQITYNTTNTTTGASTLAYTGVITVDGLQPATTYYVWARTRSSAGWSAYSPVATIRTIAGAWYKVDDVWKEAIPYVNDGGTWKIARPWSRDAGVWKEAR